MILIGAARTGGCAGHGAGSRPAGRACASDRADRPLHRHRAPAAAGCGARAWQDDAERLAPAHPASELRRAARSRRSTPTRAMPPTALRRAADQLRGYADAALRDRLCGPRSLPDDVAAAGRNTTPIRTRTTGTIRTTMTQPAGDYPDEHDVRRRPRIARRLRRAQLAARRDARCTATKATTIRRAAQSRQQPGHRRRPDRLRHARHRRCLRLSHLRHARPARRRRRSSSPTARRTRSFPQPSRSPRGCRIASAGRATSGWFRAKSSRWHCSRARRRFRAWCSRRRCSRRRPRPAATLRRHRHAQASAVDGPAEADPHRHHPSRWRRHQRAAERRAARARTARPHGRRRAPPPTRAARDRRCRSIRHAPAPASEPARPQQRAADAAGAA